MENVITILLFIVGLVLIIKGGDYFVDSASWIAEVSGVPKFIIGATIVSLGTTLPELIVSVLAAAKGQVDMAAGNAVGSVTANTGMILGLFVVCMPFVVERSEFAFKGILMLVAAAALLIASFGGQLTMIGSVILFIIFIAFIAENVISARNDVMQDTPEDRVKIKSKGEVVKNVVMFLGGAAAIALGAQLLVDNGTKIAQLIGISERVISVIAIAIGTSLPELVTTITALRKKQGALSVGNILGANIIDLTMILPICSLISGGSLIVSSGTIRYDMPACLIIASIGVIPTIITKKFHRVQGIIMLSAYFIYLILTVFVLG